MAEVPKANLYALSELKNTTDDAIAPCLKSFGFKQNHILTDVRLAIGYSACVISAVTFYYDYIHGFEKTKSMTLWAVIFYFTLNTALTVWMWLFEGRKVFLGERKGVKITIETHAEKYSPFYHVKITSTLPGESTPHTVEAKNSFVNWFDQRGYFVEKPFRTFLQTSMPPLALYEPETMGGIVNTLKKKGKGAKSS